MSGVSSGGNYKRFYCLGFKMWPLAVFTGDRINEGSVWPFSRAEKNWP